MEWRSSLGSDERQKIVRRIMDTLQTHMPHNPPDGGMNDLLKIACRFEEKIYMSAIDLQDYLRRISVKMLSLENKSQTTNNPAAGNPPDASSQPGSSTLMQQQQQSQPQPQTSNGQQVMQQQMLKQQPQQNQALGMTQQRAVSKASSESGQTAQSAALTEQQDMVWCKLQNLKDKYLQDMNVLLQMLVQRSQQTMPNDQLVKLNHYKYVLNRMIPYLSASKANLPKEFRLDKVEAFEKQIVNIMETFKKRKLPHQQQQQQQPPPQQGMLGSQMSTVQHAPVTIPGTSFDILCNCCRSDRFRMVFLSESGQTAQSAALTEQQDMVWNKLQNLKDKYLQDMNDLLQMLVQRSQQTMPNDQLVKLNDYKDVLNRTIPYLSASKANLPKEFRLDKVEVFEKQIVNIMETFKKRKLPQHQQPPQQGCWKSVS